MSGILTWFEAMPRSHPIRLGVVRGGVAGALCLGLGGRLAMRGLALLGRRPTGFSLGATLGILLIGTILGAVGGLAFALVSGRRSSRLGGSLFGTAFFLLLVPLQPAAIREEITAFRGHFGEVGVCFGLLFAIYGGFLVGSSGARETARSGPNGDSTPPRAPPSAS